MRVITADEISHSVEPLDLVDAMREAFVSISRSRVRTTFSLLDLDAGDMHVKAAHDVGGDVYVVKVAWLYRRIANAAFRSAMVGS
jgi:ornithine cyclodeaminase/alanine dehydrogenase-like protein (mu-crystallin family)